MKVFAIVVTFNGTKWLDNCFGSLMRSSVPINIIAIDNASTDGTSQAIKEKFPEVLLIELNENLGFGKANNIGLKKAQESGADYMFLLNQDAWIEPDTAEMLIKIHNRNQKYGVISPVHLNNDSKIDDGFLIHCLKDYHSSFLYDAFLRKFQSDVYEVLFVNAAAWLIPITTINAVGGFLPIFPHYGEDENFCERIRKTGLKVGFVPGVTIMHDREYFKKNRPLYDVFNRIYIHFLLILTSPFFYGKRELLYALLEACLKMIYKNIHKPVKILLVPFAMLKLLANLRKIKKQRRIFFSPEQDRANPMKM